jgi:hypothetical protein
MIATSSSGRRPHADMEHVFRRRRRVALGVLAGFFLLLVWLVASPGGGGGGGDGARESPQLPRAGRLLFPGHRIVAYYGAPQNEELGVLGIGTPEQAAQKLLARAGSYARPRHPVLPAFELIATIAHAAPGRDGLHRERQSDAVITRYLRAARRAHALMILDIQPGQASFIDEVEALEPYLRQPDVGLALDPEWSMPAGVVPGQAIGSTDAATVNDVSEYLSRIVRMHDLPQKLLLVHQFTEGMVTDDEQIVPRPGVALVSNIDGFGAPDIKIGVYKQLTSALQAPGIHAGEHIGVKLFFKEDESLLAPRSVLSLRPRPDVVVYE